MKKYIFLFTFVILMFNLNILYAQFISKSSNDTLNNYSEARQLYHSSNTLYYASIKYNYSSSLNSIVFIKSDTMLNILWSKIMNIEEIVALDNLFELSDSSILLNGFCYDDSLDKVYNVLINFNQNGDTIWTRKIFDQQYDIGLSIFKVFSDSLLFYGTISDSLISGIIVSFDLSMKSAILSSKYSIANEPELRIVRAEYDPLNNNVVAIFFTSDPLIPVNKFHLARIDLNRDVKTTMHLFDPSTGYPLLKLDTLTSNLFIGINYNSGPSSGQNYFYSLLDSTFTVIYAHELNAPAGFRNLRDVFFNAQGVIYAFDHVRTYEFNSNGISDSLYKLFGLPNWSNIYYTSLYNKNTDYYAIGVFRKQLQNILNNLTISKGKINTTYSCLGNPQLNNYITTSFTPTFKTSIHTNYFGIQTDFLNPTISTYNFLFYDNCIVTPSVEITDSKTRLKIYPNPTSDYFLLDGLETNKEYQLIFINSMGSNVATQIISNVESIQIDCLKSLPTNIYTLIITNNEFVLVKKIVKS
ncbi:MAG: T9SS type A sorting domain-containing protein [Bacteroidia bacterium]